MSAFSDIITFTRASAAWRYNEFGIYEQVPANQPRFDYDPVTLALRGLLIEEQRTNLLTYSNDFTNAAWLKTDTTPSTDGTLAPDGGPMQLLTQGSAMNGFVGRASSVSISPGTFTASRFFKRGNHDWVRLSIAADAGGNNAGHAWFNLATGTVGSTLATGSATSVTSRIRSCGGGIYRCEVSTTLATSTANSISSGVTGDTAFTRVSGGSRYEWLGQLEAGSFASSPIPTLGSQVTRAADVASVNTLSPWFNPVAGTIYAEWDASGGLATNSPVWVLQGSGTNIIRQRAEAARPLFDVYTDGVAQASISVGAPVVAGVTRKTAAAWMLNSFQAAADGSLGAPDVSGSIPSVTQLAFVKANVTAASFNGHLRRIRYWPRRLFDNELQRITA
ncbi:hypothetical protein [Pseudomonas citronellolis]|uniref:phage head spike fiber domain-containing protein n=1 Tax=Pseudomonas citronellolis TaxID=53408 RepID=UPI003899F847